MNFGNFVSNFAILFGNFVQQKGGANNPVLFKQPYFRKPTPLTAPSEQWNAEIQAAYKNSRPVSPPKPPPQVQNSTTELGWTSPVDAYGLSAQEELLFLISPFKTVKEYGASRVAGMRISVVCRSSWTSF